MLPQLNSDMEKIMWKNRAAYEPEITIVTALFNGFQTLVPQTRQYVGVYTTEWVDKLYRGIARNYNGPFGFICLTDQNYRFEESNIKLIRFERSVDQYGWMSLMEWYRPDLCVGNRITLGLDTIITGSLDRIFAYKPEKLAVCKDPYENFKICNAVTMATPEFCTEVWPWWKENENKLMQENLFQGYPSEMVLLRNYYGDSHCLDYYFPEIVSYKAHVATKFVTIKDSSIVYFHGKPKPHEISNHPWVRTHWV